MKEKAIGYVVYEGPSAVDGKPIAVIINKIDADSENTKTGGLVQSFIIRTDIAPTDALKTGDDESVCGNCQHRPVLAKQSGEPPCYVNVGRSVRSVYGAYTRGRYERVTPKQAGKLLAGKRIRLGTYGDPGAAPLKVWQDVIAHADGHTGYSHLWQRHTSPKARDAWAKLVMASADNAAEYLFAKSLGWRTFRVATDWVKADNEVRCPASKEMGAKTTCEACLLCGGTTTNTHKDIVIIDHAMGFKKRVIPMLAVPA